MSARSGLVKIVNDKGKVSLQTVKVQRYASGKRPNFACSSSDEDESDGIFQTLHRKSVQSTTFIDEIKKIECVSKAELNDPRLIRMRKRQFIEEIKRKREMESPDFQKKTAEEKTRKSDRESQGSKRSKSRWNEESVLQRVLSPNNAFAKPTDPPNKNKRMDYEIVALGTHLRSYAETVESRLKAAGLRVDILFPKPDKPVEDVFEDISSRGMQCAVEVSDRDKFGNTVTLVLLRENPKRRICLSVKEAVSTLAAALRDNSSASNSSDTDEGGNSIASTSGCSHPSEIGSIITILNENRALSIVEYDCLINYLISTRDGLAKKLGAPPREKLLDEDVKSKLYKDVLSILIDSESKITTPPQPAFDPDAPLDMDSPLMKKALETILANKNALAMLHSYSSEMLNSSNAVHKLS